MGEPIFREIGVRDVVCGERVQIVRPSNLYGCVLGDDCFVGPFVEIQRDARIGARTRVQSHSFICEFVSIGDDCFVSHGVMFTNDLMRTGAPAYGDRENWSRTIVGNHVMFGTNSTILPVRICSHVVIGAGSVVTRDIKKPGIYAGAPARFIRSL